MKAAVYEQFQGPVNIGTVDDPVPGENGAVLKVAATGVCRSEFDGIGNQCRHPFWVFNARQRESQRLASLIVATQAFVCSKDRAARRFSPIY